MKLGTSQNGWPVYDETSHFVRVKVEGIGFWAANSDVAVVLSDFAQWFHDHIERLDLPVSEYPGYDDWSHAVRPVRGQTTGYSNHGSATAWDLNSTRHPRGVRGTYTSAQRTKLRNKINSYDGVLRHGEFYTTTIDGMHVEINASSAAVKRVADRIRTAREELDMDAAQVQTIVEKALDHWATTKKFIPNTDLNGVSSGDWDLQGVLEKSDQKADRANAKQDAADARMEALEAKVDKLLGLLTPPAASAGPTK